jgi:hypothetical protein
VHLLVELLHLPDTCWSKDRVCGSPSGISGRRANQVRAPGSDQRLTFAREQVS